jgi:replicative DNA helicase
VTAVEDPTELADLAPPHDLAAEMSVIGAMLLAPAVADEISEILDAEDFYRPANGMIFRAILDVAARGDPPDGVIVADELASRDQLIRAGGIPYLHTCAERVPTAANGAWYARIVAEKAGRRKILEAGVKLMQLARAGSDLAEVRESAAETAYRATTDVRDRALIESVGDLAGPAIAHIEDVAAGRIEPGIPTGLEDYDRLTGGHKPGQLVIPAGRTSMGKSVITQNWIYHGVKTTMRPGILFSVEMSKDEMMQRLLAQVARVPLHRILHGSIDHQDRRRLHKAEQFVLTLPLYLVDTCRTVPAVRAYCRRFAQRIAPPALIGVDYLQRLQASGRFNDRQELVSGFADDLKNLSQDMYMPIIAPCQLNRGPENRPGKEANRPKLSDLRESGNLEQTADIVALLFRPDYYDRDSPRQGEVDIDVAKNRNGPTDTVTVAHQLHLQRFMDMPTVGDPPEPEEWQH